MDMGSVTTQAPVKWDDAPHEPPVNPGEDFNVDDTVICVDSWAVTWNHDPTAQGPGDLISVSSYSLVYRARCAVNICE